jgi:outer membrane protein TolC
MMMKPFYLYRILSFLILIGVTGLSIPGTVRGEAPPAELSFPDIWALVQKNAPSEQAAEFELQASLMEEERALRLGYPRLYLDARAFSTNDPALSFASTLEQRQIQPGDFSPDALNHPGNPFYQKAALELDWPVYDGGARSSRLQSRGKTVLAKTFGQKTGSLDLYVETASLFGSVLIFDQQENRLQKLLETVQNVLAGYRIGVKTNPLGYSGRLGLETLINQITGTLAENNALMNEARMALGEKAGGLPGPVFGSTDPQVGKWNPQPEPGGPDILNFVKSALTPPASGPEKEGSPQVRMLDAEAESLAWEIENEKAKKGPRAGIFSEAALNHGDRDAASSYVLGVYLRWDLFAAENYKKGEQAEASALALKAKAESFRLNERIESRKASLSAQALEKEISLMSKNLKLLEEQSQTSKKLFLNGSINVLQFIEVLNQNFDLFNRLTRAESECLRAGAIRFKSSGAEAPAPAAGSAGPFHKP